MTGVPYNPLDKLNLGHSVAEALLETPILPLAETEHLKGAGAYAIYYTGPFAPYEPVAQLNRDARFEQPIYVGKAVPKGARKGGLGFDAARGTALRTRLRQHAASIDESNNLDLADFHCRSLMVDDIWIPLGENMLIEEFRPIWNLLIDGFGNKDPGRRRATQHRSSWDVLHPGRAFAEKLALGNVTAENIIAEIEAYFAGSEVPLVPLEEATDAGEE